MKCKENKTEIYYMISMAILIIFMLKQVFDVINRIKNIKKATRLLKVAKLTLHQS